MNDKHIFQTLVDTESNLIADKENIKDPSVNALPKTSSQTAIDFSSPMRLFDSNAAIKLETNETRKPEIVPLVKPKRPINNSVMKEICTQDQLFTAIKEGVTKLCIHACDQGKEKKDYDIWIMSELLKKTSKLQQFEINLDHAETSNEGCKSIGEVIKVQTPLTSFKLSYHGSNKINDLGLEYILQGLKDKDLDSLSLCFCDAECSITDYGAMQIANLLNQIPFLAKLELNFGSGANKITDEGVMALSESIEKLKFLEDLELLFYHGKNEVTDKGLEAVAGALTKLENLKILALDFYEGNNKISDPGFTALHRALKGKKTLTKVEIHVKGVKKVNEQIKKSLRIDIKRNNPECTIDIL
jgi:hypothetical protein